tara:strand:- start:108 stop:818 length:711 start_codon:yes stop_codon:yes gene_type:complete
MWEVINLVRRTIEGSVSAIVVIAVVAVLGLSDTINMLIADRSPASILFLFMLAILLADLIAKFIGILSATFPDLVPKFDDDVAKRASLIRRLRPGQTIALLSGAYAARVALFLIIFALLGASYAAAPQPVQASLFGAFPPITAINAFVREGIAGSLGYFLFFLGPDHMKPITDAIMPQPLVSSTVDGDILLVGIRIYGLAFVLAVLRTLVTPVTYVRARLRTARGKLADHPADAVA